MLGQQANNQAEKAGETGLQIGMAVDFPADVAKHPAEIGPQTFELATHPLELLGMGVAPRFHRRPLGQACVALPQLDAG